MSEMFAGLVTFVYTTDLARASALWEGVLGLECAVDQGACRIYRVSPGGFVGVCSLPDRPHGTAGLTLTLVTPDVDAICRKVERAGYELLRGPAYVPEFDIYSALFLDGDGYRIEIEEFRSHPELSGRS